MKKQALTILLLVAIASGAAAQSKTTIQSYIDKYRDIAMQEMQRTGVPAAITLAQGIHETGAGTSNLVVKSNNHFGIKCKTEWVGEKVYHDDDARGECFRKYDDPAISYKDHSDFLRNRPHYASLFTLDPTDFEAWAHGLKKAGYATNPKYPQILIKLIRDYNLQDYTLIAMGRKEYNPSEPQWTSASEGISTALNPEPPAVMQAPSVVYPAGVFRINDTKAVYVAKGTSYLNVAEEQSLSLARLMEFNDRRDGDVAMKDELLFLQRKRKTGAHETHLVVAGETLYDIAQAEGIRLENLLEYNFLTANVLPAAGETLHLQGAAPAKPRLANDRPMVAMASFRAVMPAREETEATALTHTVQPKETLYGIARKYNVTTEELKTWNGIEANDVRIGQQLKINKR